MDGKWALVLGITGGTGSAVARAVAADPGLHLFGIHRGNRPDQAEEVRRDVEGLDRKLEMRVASAGTLEDAAAGAEDILARIGPGSIRLFVHSIADASYGVFATPGGRWLEPRHFHRTFESMANSFVYWTQELLRKDLLAPGAVLLGLSNPMMDSVTHGWGAVAAAKEALAVYVRHLGDELGPQGYSVALLKFGMVETRAIQIAFTPERWQQTKADIESLTPAGRLCAVEEVGRFVSYMAREGATWFNGSTIDFTGGQIKNMLDRVFNRR